MTTITDRRARIEQARAATEAAEEAFYQAAASAKAANAAANEAAIAWEAAEQEYDRALGEN